MRANESDPANDQVWGAMMRLLLLSLLMLGLAGAAYAQAAAGGLAGKLIDLNGLPVTGLHEVDLTLKDSGGKTYTANIQGSGDYAVPGVPAGNYELRIPLQCCMYRTYEQKNVVIKPGETLRLDIVLQWGINLGTIGDDPAMLSNDLRARSTGTEGPTPRTADGKPDLTGMWGNVPNNDPLPPFALKPWAKEISDKLEKMPNRQGPGAYCLPQAAIPLTRPYPYEFVQTRERLIQMTEEEMPSHRQIYLDGRPHPTDWNPAWQGHSVARWEGDTLVIDTVGFNEVTPGFGVHSEKLHVIERITRPSRGQLVIDIIAEDPEAWTGQWTHRIVAGLITGEEITEFICPENNKDPLHFGGLGWSGRP
jgi:hypothetical protein